MFELLHSSNTGGLIPVPACRISVSPWPDLNILSRQSCAVSFCNAASQGFVWNGLTLWFTLMLPQAAPS